MKITRVIMLSELDIWLKGIKPVLNEYKNVFVVIIEDDYSVVDRLWLKDILGV